MHPIYTHTLKAQWDLLSDGSFPSFKSVSPDNGCFSFFLRSFQSDLQVLEWGIQVIFTPAGKVDGQVNHLKLLGVATVLDGIYLDVVCTVLCL